MAGIPKEMLRMLLGLALLAVVAVGQRPGPLQAETKLDAKGGHLPITPNVMTGLLMGLVWISIFLAGFCCLFQVQTPLSFEEKALPMNKLY